jgi:hypothetical protein
MSPVSRHSTRYWPVIIVAVCAILVACNFPAETQIPATIPPTAQPTRAAANTQPPPTAEPSLVPPDTPPLPLAPTPRPSPLPPDKPTVMVFPTLVPLPPDTPTFTPTPTLAASATPQSVKDCLPYDPNNLRLVDEGSSGWLLTDGVSRMLMLDNAADAQDALAVAKRYTAHCFIGRDNSRPNRRDYIVTFWLGNSGLNTSPAQKDCIAYRQDRLSIVDEGTAGWLLTDGSSRMVMLDNEHDAQDALQMAKQYQYQCFIGRSNSRPDRKLYIMSYWE